MLLHDGTSGTSSLAPVVAAPDSIGELRSYAADLTTSGLSPDFGRARMRSRVMQIVWTILAAAITGFGSSDFVSAPVMVGLAAGAFTFALLELFHPKPRTTFVGSKGIAVITHERTPRVSELRFADVDHLRVERILAGPGNGRLRFVHAFETKSDETLFRIDGGANLASDGSVSAGSENALWFASAAETAWVAWRLPHLLTALQRGEAVTFLSARRETVTLQGDEVELFPAEGGRVRAKLPRLHGPDADGEMLRFVVTLNPPLTSDDAFRAPGEERACIFRGNEFRDVALLRALLDALRGTSGQPHT